MRKRAHDSDSTTDIPDTSDFAFPMHAPKIESRLDGDPANRSPSPITVSSDLTL